MNHKPRKGRKPNHHVTSNGEIIAGLRRDKKSGRFYPVGKGSPSFGTDEAKAVHKFRVWLSQQGETKPRDILILPNLDEVLEANRPGMTERSAHLAPVAEANRDNLLSMIDLESIREAERNRLRDLIYTDAKQAAIELDCEPVALLANVKDLKPPSDLTLAEIGSLYAKKKFRDPNEAKRSELYWLEFCQAVAPATTVDEVTQEQLQEYHDRMTVGKLSPKTIRNRYRKIPTMFNYAKDRHKNHRQAIEELKTDFQMICVKHAPKVPKPIPKIMEPDDFSACLKASSLKWRAMLLLMLNAGLHPGELAGLQKQDANLKRRYLWDHRNKTTNQRCSMLWKRTVEAIRAYQKAESHDSPYLFVNRNGDHFQAGSMAEYFAKYLREQAEVPKHVTLDHIRKGATHAASKNGADSDHIRMWLGHGRGDLDAYDPRQPSKTQDVVDAVEQEFFGKKG